MIARHERIEVRGRSKRLFPSMIVGKTTLNSASLAKRTGLAAGMRFPQKERKVNVEGRGRDPRLTIPALYELSSGCVCAPKLP